MQTYYYIEMPLPVFILLSLFFMITGAFIVIIVYTLEAGKIRRKHLNEIGYLEDENAHLRLKLTLKALT